MTSSYQEAPLCKGQILRQCRTLKSSVSIAGIGLFTGEQVSLHITPQGAECGIVFERIDLPSRPRIEARLENVQSTPRCTILGNADGSVQTVEHLLAALYASGITSALIQISGPEVPILDGSSFPFSELLKQAGFHDYPEKSPILKLKSPVFWSQGDIHIAALPSCQYRLSYTLHYPHARAIGTQFYSYVLDQESFKKEIAPCRTFSVYEEIAPMIEKGLLKGGSLENAVIIKGDTVVNPDGLRFNDEMGRHKVLDLIGDLSLVPVPFLAHIIAVRSGHTSNVAFAKELYNHLIMENM